MTFEVDFRMRKQQQEITNDQWKISKPWKFQNNAINGVKQVSQSHIIRFLIRCIPLVMMWSSSGPGIVNFHNSKDIDHHLVTVLHLVLLTSLFAYS